jgi:hypothetical protein
VVVPEPEASPNPPDAQVGDLVQLVKDYARQETLGPITGFGRYVAFGIAGAFLVGLGMLVVLLGLLRMLQTEADWLDGPNTALLGYLITIAVGAAFIGLAVWQIKRRTSLNKDQ